MKLHRDELLDAALARIARSMYSRLPPPATVASSSLLSVATMPTEARAILRHEDGELDYLTLFLVCEDEQVVVSDVLTWKSARRLSECWGELLASFDSRAGRRERDLEQLEALPLPGRPGTSWVGREAAAIRARMTPELRTHPRVLALLLKTIPSSRPEFDEVLAEVDGAVLEHPELHLARVEALVRADRDPLAAIDALDAAVGGDPALDEMRAAAHLRAGRKDRAHEAARRLLGTLREDGSLEPAARRLWAAAVQHGDVALADECLLAVGR